MLHRLISVSIMTSIDNVSITYLFMKAQIIILVWYIIIIDFSLLSFRGS